MKIVSEVKNQQEFDELKTIIEVYVFSNRIKEIAQNA